MKGLSTKEVEQRKKQGLINGNFSVKTKSFGQIVYTNVFTRFNMINTFLAGCLVAVHSYKNMMFMGVVFWNILIGVVQELRSKRIIDKLSLLSEAKAHVYREGIEKEIRIEDVVLDDLILLKNGNQVPVDAVIMEGQCEVNESLLTGESDPVFKKAGDEILSGSYIISGQIEAKAVHVGQENYVNKITGQAKYLKKPNSEMLRSIQTIIKIVSIALIPVAGMLFFNQVQLGGNPFAEAVVSTVAAVIGMIPSGLVLLTSMVLAVSVIRLGQKNTLVQELYCIETLARVDTLCLDKTGTITEGVMDVDGIEILSPDFTKNQIDEIIYFFTEGLNDDNPTFHAMKDYSARFYEGNESALLDQVKEYTVVEKIGFSSDKKWSLVDFEKRGTYVIGALEFVFSEVSEELKNISNTFARDGVRVLVLAHSKQHCDGHNLPDGLEAYAFLLLTDRIRKSAPDTLRYFKNQGVDIKIISGDNPQTVSNIGKRTGLLNADKFIDASTITTEEEMERAVREYTVFGRVTPKQKLRIVEILKGQGHTVAMTGDGVNDVMALKEADCSIAMQSGSDAARNVSQLVLMDSDFASMPYIVAEGRRTINNIQRSAALYLTKTIYSAVLALLFVFIQAGYPFKPIQLTLLGSLAIGIPSFILAMEPNLNRVKGSFLLNVLKLAIPGGMIVITNVVLVEILGFILHMPEAQTETLAFFGLAIASLVELFKVCKPFNTIRISMCSLLIGLFTAAVIFFGSFFEVSGMNFLGMGIVLLLLCITPALHMIYSVVVGKIMGNTPNVYSIQPVYCHRCNELENGERIVIVRNEVEEKDYMDVAAQMMGLRVLKCKNVVFLKEFNEKNRIKIDFYDRMYDECVVAAAAEYYVKKCRHTRELKKEDKEEILVETNSEKPEEQKIYVGANEKNFRTRIFKQIKITF